ncbi:HEAT repeat domain-containing protein [Aggregicoccus sp. 17bor-14]|uniref:HEAT repeat domain-containing protein n=1 Tax=Myxococcaceae TaxID=31 RepID=UPI00129C60F4|nr:MULTISPECIES: HEAT repeat domain-containing protein [Myxococcaceae]MBF5044722.1 HEAT repeat domain-containing protein [Simulacricoccus sp. 17bor-14]MRI90466.1 HEAT repeat domain-containing protein [Aggregicoccus sp. 17bor-14]
MPLLALLVLALLAPTAALAQGDGRIAYLSRQLERAKDPRVRAQSALVLGATEDPEALQPLCRALADPSELVRAAAARSLGTLGEPGGLDCLHARPSDPDAEAERARKEALGALQAARDRPPRFYLAFAGVADKSGQLDAALTQLAEARLRRKLASLGALLAPADESKANAKSVLKKRRLKGYRLSAEVLPGPGGGLKLALLCMTYPEQSLLGQVEVKASGAKPADLLKALAPRAVDEAAQTFEWSP